jgi:hypothetical protein
MTPDQKIELWVASLTALPTIVFTGWVAWWTWRRDQERIIVQYSPLHWKTIDGKQTDATLCALGIVVRNLSLYPVRITALGFLLEGKTPFALDHDLHSREWPEELASHARLLIYATDQEWIRLEGLGIRERIKDGKLEAVATTEMGRKFFSHRLRVRIAGVVIAAIQVSKRVYGRIKKMRGK